MACDAAPGDITVAFIGNQGGQDVLSFYLGMAEPMRIESSIQARFSVWLDRECVIPTEFGFDKSNCSSFENFVRNSSPVTEGDVDRVLRDYREVNWSEVVAVERAFTDYSMLLGSAGHRRETIDYVQTLLVRIVRYLESVVAGCNAVVCQTADTLFSLVAVKVARHHGVPVYAIRPATLLEPGSSGGFFANDEYLVCNRMVAAYEKLRNLELLPDEIARTRALANSIAGFNGLTSYHAATSKGKSRGRHALTPNLKRLLPHLKANAKRDKAVEYIKFDPARKIAANFLRVVRKRMASGCYGSLSIDSIPKRSVFYALHYQPEQSTLAQGVWHANQVALIENISKSLPLGYTLIVKEHPWGRGNRPRWQYEHMSGLYNVMFCDGPAKQIIQQVEAVITVTGTVAVEALVFDKPSIMLGRNYFDFCDLLYIVNTIQELPDVLARILIDGDYKNQPNRERRLQRFLMAYLEGLIPHFPLREHAGEWGRALALELTMSLASRSIDRLERST